jgi:predicted HAD superfamily Cof-like phosphohydrolase
MKTNPILERERERRKEEEEEEEEVIMNVQKHTHAYSFLFLCFKKVAEYVFYYYELSLLLCDPDEVFYDLFVHDEHMSEIFFVYSLFFQPIKKKKKKEERNIVQYLLY